MSKKSPSPVSLREVAAKAGVSRSAASLALRGHPRIGAATRRRVAAAAKQLGYATNPLTAAVLSQIRLRRHHGDRLAFVWIDVTRAESIDGGFREEIRRGAKETAAAIGWSVEEYWLSDPQMTPRRLEGILKARGIRGAVFSPCMRQTTVALQWDWASLATAVIGVADWTPELPRTAHNHFLGMARALHELSRLGYKRPLAVLRPLVDTRAHLAQSAAFLAHHPRPAQARHLVHHFGSGDAELLARSERLGADAWIIADAVLVDQLTDLHLLPPPEVGLVVLSRSGLSPHWAGIDQLNAHIAGTAIRLVISQLLRNEAGVPPHPDLLLCAGSWVPGPTAPGRGTNCLQIPRRAQGQTEKSPAATSARR